MSNEKIEQLVELELESSAGLGQVIEEFKTLGQVQIIDVITHKGDSQFIADVTGQPGKYEFKVQGDNVVYSLGADTIVSILRGIDNASPVMTKAVALKAMKNKHYSKLRGANKRHV